MDVKKKIETAIKKALKELNLPATSFSLARPENSRYGDYATNVAMVVFGPAKITKNPLELAVLIAEKIKKQPLLDGLVVKIKAVAPGFINFYLSSSYLKKVLGEVIKKGTDFGSSQEGKSKTVVIDYSSPNIAKPFGVGHLRSTIIGQSLYNIYSFLGYRVIGDNHLGDWGTQFGKLIYQIKRKLLHQYHSEHISRSIKKNKGNIDSNDKLLRDLTISDLEKLYIEFHQKAQENPRLEKEARKWFKKLEEGDKEAKRIWQAVIDLSLKDFEGVYRLLGVSFDVVLGESFYLDKMDEVIADAKRKGILKKSQQAWVVPVPGIKTPAMLIKSDGATTYCLRDLAAIKYRQRKWHPQLIIYEVGADQSLYFRQLFAVSKKLGYAPHAKLVHIAHGMIRGFGGEKLSTRRGQTIHLEAVLKEAVSKAKQLATQAGITKNLSPGQQKKVAQVVGVGAVKYNDLKQNPRTDIIFDWNKVLTLKGNSGPYLQYTYARCCGIMAKAGGGKLLNLPDYRPNKDELAIVRHICQFREIIKAAAQSFSPNLIAGFLYILAQKYNAFYGRYPVLKADSKNKKQFRLQLTTAVAQVLENGLALLGIGVLKKM